VLAKLVVSIVSRGGASAPNVAAPNNAQEVRSAASPG